MSNMRLLTYIDVESPSQDFSKQIFENYSKKITHKINLEKTNSLAIYRISPLISVENSNISYPTITIPIEESEMHEIIDKLNKKNDMDDFSNKNFIKSSEIENKKNEQKDDEDISTEYDLKIPDEEQNQTRAKFDKYNLIKAFCITYDPYNNRLNLEENNKECELKIENIEEKLIELFEI